MIINMNDLIKAEGLDDPLTLFAEYETFEEIPVFSRFSHISFLSSLSFNEKNKVLLKTCLDLAEKCNSSIKPDHFICVSITDWDNYEEINCLTPNLFVSQRKDWLLSKLKLKSTQTVEENLVREYLNSLDRLEYDVYTAIDFKKYKRIYVVKKEA
ncbi:Imm15 family immunity protein [Xylocopilactobacillus apis]|uniref:Uncharacterized protein n=1 Tax=Xylocopilactobacillus apis TaxID=2932183 RepID=A0AAU9CTN1_9LACO|nr:Imm15 family immunity protein [Xylocopilactobacillus apis]BDR55701.1 hypothetical protein KIMC2_02630 [Xylocopilactobacillus apis]